jgi:hypothetical protein
MGTMNGSFSQMSFAIRHREPIQFPNGTYRTRRRRIDFIIDGISLIERASNSGLDLIGIFSDCWAPGMNEAGLQRLLLETASDFPNGRSSIMVCGECGDLGCGAISAHISLSGSAVVWRDLGYENTHEALIHRDKFLDLGPFQFDVKCYRSKLVEGLALLNA